LEDNRILLEKWARNMPQTSSAAGFTGDLRESSLLYCDQAANIEIHVEILALAYHSCSWEAW